MPMGPRARKLALTAHVTSSVGWLGSVAAFLALSIAGLASREADVVRGAYVAMNLIGLFVIVPLSVLALLTGLIQSLGTQWGLFRHYWVVVKFVLTIGATILLLLHQFTAVAGAARRVSGVAPGSFPDIGPVGRQLVVDAGLAVVVLLVTTTLSVYKPWGRTAYGRHRELEEATMRQRLQGTAGLSVGLKIFLAVFAVIVLAFIVLHLTGRGMGGH